MKTGSTQRLEELNELHSLTVPEANGLLRIGAPKIKEFVESGELFAFVTTPPGAQRRRIRIPAWAIREFMARRAVVAVAPSKPAKRQKSTTSVSARY